MRSAGAEKVKAERVSWVVISWDGAKQPSLNRLAAPWPVWWAIQWWLLAHVLQARSLQSLGGGGGGLSFTASWDAGIWEGETIFAISCWDIIFILHGAPHKCCSWLCFHYPLPYFVCNKCIDWALLNMNSAKVEVPVITMYKPTALELKKKQRIDKVWNVKIMTENLIMMYTFYLRLVNLEKNN